MKIKLMDAYFKDARFVLNLKNQPYVRKNSYNKNKIRWSAHIRWFKQNYKYYKIICADHHQIGYVRVNKEDKNGDIHIALLKEYHDKGIGTKVIRDMVKKHKNLTTQVVIDNTASQRMFEKAGFKKIGVVMRK